TKNHKPKFVKQYANVRKVILDAVKQYSKEVKKGTYPSLEYSYER
ncbi:MAG: 3-methyl-2-oxobutanoate hydroxymethyltransferase, partial [Candidatus Heimdallarchaeota archaeon]